MSVIKVFISHQQADSVLASQIASRLRFTHSIECYLDVVDPISSGAGDSLGEYLREQLSRCSQLMAVVSAATKSSWWVPWEIGVATEKDYPIATYAGDKTNLPEYLRKWPYLKTMEEVDLYASVSKGAESLYENKRSTVTASVARRTATQSFYRNIRSRLRQ